MNKWQQDIQDFHKAVGAYIGTRPHLVPPYVTALRRSLIKEETSELLEALFEGDLPLIADGIADSLVVIIGTAVSFGIDIAPVWDLVQQSNMAKSKGPKRADGKQLKPDGWKHPDILAEIKRQRGEL